MSKEQTKRLDVLIRRVVFNEEGQCYVCGRTPSDLAHLFVRSRLFTRWDRRNCHALCRWCHSQSHAGEDVYTQRFIEREGREAYDQLKLDSNSRVWLVGAFKDQIEEQLNEEVRNTDG